MKPKPEKPKQRGATNRTDRARAQARRTFIERLKETCNVADAARVACVAKTTAYDWRAGDVEFAKAWDEAIEIAKAALVVEARRRGVEGVDEPVFQQGKQVGTIRRYSDRMLEILLKGHFPEYREKGIEVNVHRADQPVDIREVARRIAVLLRRAKSEMEAEELRSRLLPEKILNPSTDT